MRKLIIIFILFGAMGIGIPVMASSIKITFSTEFQQPGHSKHRVVKKRRRIVKRRVSARRRQRMNKQLKQANKHLKNEKKVQRAERKVKPAQ